MPRPPSPSPLVPHLRALLFSILLLPPAAGAQVELETVAANLDSPVAITHAGDDRLFITLQGGRVVILEDDQILPTPFLDISGRVRSGNERGLLSVAFHPNHGVNGFLFACYTNLAGDVVISRFQLFPGQPDRADPGSERILLTIAQPFANHNGGQLQFGPDGYLYAGLGDGGSANDPLCRSQDPRSLLGKMLRLDVDQNVGTPPYHGIPPSNPFVGAADPGGEVRDEIWALGLRNPWRFSFDRATGELFTGDVGQDQREEIDWERAGSAGGHNYGWKRMEGTLCSGSDGGCSFPIPPCHDLAYTPPVLEYGHGGGRCSVTGGHVYRGSRLPSLAGAYLYGDFCSGQIWSARRQGGAWQASPLLVSPPFLTTFGEDAAGEIYLAASGDLLRLTGPDLPPTECTAGAHTLCLEGGRFRAEITWRTPGGQEGPGNAVPLTDDSGYFWFFNADNPEIFTKVRNACVAPFNRFWVFTAGLTNVEVRLTVTDTGTGLVKEYDNPQGQTFEAILDTDAFATCPVSPPGESPRAPSAPGRRGGNPFPGRHLRPAVLRCPEIYTVSEVVP